MRLFMVKSALFVALFWILSYVVASGLDAEFKQDRYNKEFWVLSQHGVSWDYAVVGSSRAYNNVDAPTLTKCIGRSTINMGYGGHTTGDMYLTLHLFLSHENRIGNLLLQIDGTDLTNPHEFQTFLYLPYLADSEVRTSVREAIGSRRYFLMRTLPITKYWEYNNFYNLVELRMAVARRSFSDESAGSDLLFDKSYYNFPKIFPEPKFVVDARSRRYLDQLVLLAKTHGINVTIFTAPLYHHDQVFKNYDAASRAYISNYCRENGIKYLDFADSSFDQSEFRDYVHLRGDGALRFTRMLADALKAGPQNCSTRGDSAPLSGSPHAFPVADSLAGK